jgi:hypothetical protein
MWTAGSATSPLARSVPIFCGFAPFIAARLVATTGSPLAPSYDLIATALSSLAILVDTRVKTT